MFNVVHVDYPVYSCVRFSTGRIYSALALLLRFAGNNYRVLRRCWSISSRLLVAWPTVKPQQPMQRMRCVIQETVPYISLCLESCLEHQNGWVIPRTQSHLHVPIHTETRVHKVTYTHLYIETRIRKTPTHSEAHHTFDIQPDTRATIERSHFYLRWLNELS